MKAKEQVGSASQATWPREKPRESRNPTPHGLRAQQQARAQQGWGRPGQQAGAAVWGLQLPG